MYCRVTVRTIFTRSTLACFVFFLCKVSETTLRCENDTLFCPVRRKGLPEYFGVYIAGYDEIIYVYSLWNICLSAVITIKPFKWGGRFRVGMSIWHNRHCLVGLMGQSECGFIITIIIINISSSSSITNFVVSQSGPKTCPNFCLSPPLCRFLMFFPHNIWFFCQFARGGLLPESLRRSHLDQRPRRLLGGPSNSWTAQPVSLAKNLPSQLR